jgi:hypothetical protein
MWFFAPHAVQGLITRCARTDADSDERSAFDEPADSCVKVADEPGAAADPDAALDGGSFDERRFLGGCWCCGNRTGGGAEEREGVPWLDEWCPCRDPWAGADDVAGAGR